MLLPRRLANAILVVVSVVWVINFGAQFFVPAYHPDISINGIFIAIVGGSFALSRKGDPRDDDDEEDGDDGDGDGDGDDGPPAVPPPRPPWPPAVRRDRPPDSRRYSEGRPPDRLPRHRHPRDDDPDDYYSEEPRWNDLHSTVPTTPLLAIVSGVGYASGLVCCSSR